MTKRHTSDNRPADEAEADAASIREAKASVHEAIGKLIGDDAAEAQGTAEKQAANSEQTESQSQR